MRSGIEQILGVLSGLWTGLNPDFGLFCPDFRPGVRPQEALLCPDAGQPTLGIIRGPWWSRIKKGCRISIFIIAVGSFEFLRRCFSHDDMIEDVSITRSGSGTQLAGWIPVAKKMPCLCLRSRRTSLPVPIASFRPDSPTSLLSHPSVCIGHLFHHRRANSGATPLRSNHSSCVSVSLRGNRFHASPQDEWQ
ncbi:hypothetical protein OBBRIDRAFT_628290 [Obba rivulosa]|uniref:Uncharacterized protein n=1 Tax=Obba rivulosa TaxID=1052685 RepID=A0A8E2ASB4_9APHY|nr:hypothetical protein OBBRIDRAFT_628290 [Obba rivulosa]